MVLNVPDNGIVLLPVGLNEPVTVTTLAPFGRFELPAIVREINPLSVVLANVPTYILEAGLVPPGLVGDESLLQPERINKQSAKDMRTRGRTTILVLLY